jgi:hypothetical protein
MPSDHPTLRVCIVWRGDAEARAAASAETSRLKAIFAALARRGIAAEPCVWDDGLDEAVRAQIAGADGVLVWVDPISTQTGARRLGLDALLREAAARGVFVSGRPDVLSKMGVKAVLHATRDLGWGSDTAFYESAEDFAAGFPPRLAAGPKVLKQNRGNGGIGVWKVEAASEGAATIREARAGAEARTLPMAELLAERAGDFASEVGGLVEQPFQPRHLDGMVRCYMVADRVAGFGCQLVRALAEPQDGPASPRLYSGPADPRFQRLKALMERDWTPGLCRTLAIAPDDLPVIWDADFLLGPKMSDGEDSYVLCEINANSVFPVPDEAPDALAAVVRDRLMNARREPAA